jgi:transposase
MPRERNITIKESILELKKIAKKQPSIQRQKRVNCLLFIKLSKFKTRQALADHLGVHIRTQERWIATYRKDGLNAMLHDKPQNKPSKIITQQIHQGLSEKVKDANNPLLGYWDAQNWVKEEFNTEVKYHWLRAYMIKHFKTKLKSPRKSHIKKDEQAVESFFKTASYTKQA